jgi:hypothetical protein
MKALLSMVFADSVATVAFGDGLDNVVIDGNSYSNITKVYVGSTGRIIIVYPDGGTSASVDKVPTNFLASWNINQALQNAAKSTATDVAENNLERAIQSGCFREVNGVVYDTRKHTGCEGQSASRFFGPIIRSEMASWTDPG